MAQNTGNASRLLPVGLRHVMFQEYNEREKEYQRLFNMKTSTRNYEEDLEFVGLGVQPLKAEGTAVVYADATQGEIKRYTHVAFGSGFRATREIIDDDQYGVLKMTRMAKELGKGANNVREVRAANVFNNGFTVADGFPKAGTTDFLFTTTHTCIGGGADLSNTASSDLDQAALEAAIISFHNLTDENGIPIVVIPKVLLVPPALIMVARELLGSEYKPYTANNEINPTRADGLQLEVNHYLTDADSWFVLAGKGDHDLNFFVRTDLEFDYGSDFDTGDDKVKAFQRFSVGYGDWRGTYGGLGV